MEYVGGRMIYIESCIFFIEKTKWEEEGPEMIFQKISDRFFTRVLSQQKAIVADKSSESIAILQVSKMGM